MRDEILHISNLFSNTSCIEIEKGILFKGSLLINKVHKDFPVYKKFELKIIIPNEIKLELPLVWEIGNQVDSAYSHRYTDGRLCLATDSEMKIDFIKGMTLVEWVDKYVISYFYSYEYFQRFGEYPFGERSHGPMGTLEFYLSLFSLKDIASTYRFMSRLIAFQYRGHSQCICGSGLKTRDCHGKILLSLAKNDLIGMVYQDYSVIREELNEVKNRR